MNVTANDISQGTALYNAGRFAEAREKFERAAQERSDDPKVLSLLAATLAGLGEMNAAYETIERALRLNSNIAMVHVMSGHVYSLAGQIEQAEHHFRQAVNLSPDHPFTLHSLGYNLIGQGRFREALVFLQKAAEHEPSIPDLKQQITSIHWQLNNLEKASELLLEILEKSPKDVAALNELGLVRKSQGRVLEAIELFQKAIEIDPQFALANKNLGTTYQEIGDANAAADQFDRYERIDPSIEILLLNALVLPVVPESSDEIDKWRSRLTERMTKVSQSGQTISDPFRQILRDQFHLAYHGKNDKDIQKHIAETYLKVVPSLSFTAPHIGKTLARDRIKVGFVSSNFRHHTIGHLNIGYIQHLDRSKFEVHIISRDDQTDEVRKKIESEADHAHVAPRHLEQAQSFIADQEFDLLYYPDIGMDTFSYFLAFARLAPVQAVSWGHPVTTGIPTVDYFVSCDLMEPEGAEDAYLEKLIRLPDAGGYYFRPIDPGGALDRDQYNLPNDRPLIACLQSSFKLHPDFDPVLKAVLSAVPEAVLVLIDFQSEHLSKRLERTLGAAFEQVIFSGPFATDEFLRLSKEADVILDIPQWSGGRSGYETLAMGTPIVHKPGEFMRGRHTLAFYKTIGVLDCVAETDEEYVGLAVRLVRDRDFNKSIQPHREKISANVAKLFKRQSAVKALENFFIEAVDRARR